MVARGLSVCLIVKNEAEYLPDCLASVASIADEIVVADTGSTDQTRQLAFAHNARVVDVLWTDDFSAARNACLEHATRDWVLFLDADERLEPLGPGDQAQLAAQLARPEARGYSVEIRSPRDQHTTEIGHVVRLFQRHPQIRYRGRVHESVVPSIAQLAGVAHWTPSRSVIRITHLGYQAQVRHDKQKDQRNRRLLDQMLQDAPHDPGVRFLAARERISSIDGDLLDTDASRSAFELLQPAIPALLANPNLAICEPALTLCLRLAHTTGQAELVPALWDQLYRLVGATARVCYLRGEGSLAQDPVEAAKWFARVADAPEGSATIITETVMRTEWSNARLDAARRISGAASDPSIPMLARERALLQICLQSRSLQGLVRLIESEPNDPRSWWCLSRWFEQAGESEKAATTRATALRLAPGWRTDQPTGLLATWRTFTS
jgi:hypothetical protein